MEQRPKSEAKWIDGEAELFSPVNLPQPAADRQREEGEIQRQKGRDRSLKRIVRMHQSPLVEILVLLLFVLTLSACAMIKPKPKPGPLTLDSLKNAEYDSSWPMLGKARLTDGVYRESFIPGSSTEIVIKLSDQIAMGDLNGDGVEDAVVVLVSSPGGSGTFYDLAAVINYNGIPKHMDTVPLGDRIRVTSLHIESGKIIIEMIVHGPKDPMCCPTVAVTKSYKLQEYKLVRAD